jgi:hypothetical protein
MSTAFPFVALKTASILAISLHGLLQGLGLDAGTDANNYGRRISSYENTARIDASNRDARNVPIGDIDQSRYPYNLILCGAITPKLVLLPAFTLKTLGGSFREPAGPYSIIGKDVRNNRLFMESFDQDVYAQDGSGGGTFCFTLPITDEAYSHLNSLTLVANGSSTTLTSAAINPPVVTAVSNGSGTITISWNGGQYPLGDVVGSDVEQYIRANALTGLSTATISSSSTSLAISFSDNVKTTNVTVQVTQR